VESLYALLALVLWPLDAADDVALLVHGAKRMIQASKLGGKLGLGVGGVWSIVPSGPGGNSSENGEDDDPEIDVVRLWYAICANETM